MSSDNAIFLDAVCKRYGMLPSDYVGIKNKAVAIDFDMAIALRGNRAESNIASSVEAVEDKSALPSVRANPDKTKAQMANLEALMQKADTLRGKK